LFAEWKYLLLPGINPNLAQLFIGPMSIDRPHIMTDTLFNRLKGCNLVIESRNSSLGLEATTLLETPYSEEVITLGCKP